MDNEKPPEGRLIDRLWEGEQIPKDFRMALELSPMYLERNTPCDENDVAVFEPDIRLGDNVRRCRHRSGLGTEAVEPRKIRPV